MPALTIEQVVAWLAGIAPAGQLASDTRRLKTGDIFFAYPGDAGDGRHHIAAAIDQGAAAVLYDDADFAWNPAWAVPHLAVASLKQQAGPLAHAFYKMPDAAMFSIGITGTNGKTSCALWLGQALSRVGLSTGVIGTLGAGIFPAGTSGLAAFDATGYTTPDAVLLARKLADMRGVDALALEVSSIGLVQQRVAGMHFDVALFTNLTRDHLDYHGDLAQYEAAKARLFDWPGLKCAVVNLDDAMGLRLVTQLAGKLPLFGYTLLDAAAQPEIAGVNVLRAGALRNRNKGTDFHVECSFGTALVKTGLIGRFNISNALAVLAVLLAKGIPWRAAIDSIEALTPAPGRMQQVASHDAPMVIIDYAHTPDALEKTLAALRQVAEQRGGRLWCVFGCGGDRDPGKRAQMGAVALMADQVLVTSDNPRSEDANSIIEQIVAGMAPSATEPDAQSGCAVLRIEDRAAAILYAIKHAARPDVILVAGKGHEQYQEIKGKKLPFSDTDHAALALAARATMMRTN
ncbi:MAG: UDP-N-acetylmuramoyl-L-alanyl-D-glutamate--2,6-diaminopimelate ligase [Janthinobacterium sp.]|jgi:UDP-N-acetylmuramoyl-L-alanyl-D-glutamate--2,6-diaminopimelate ligase